MSHPDVAAVRGAAIPTLAVGIVVTVVAAATRGPAALVGGLLGTAVVLTFFVVGQVVVSRVLESNPQIGMSTALLVYTLQVLALLVLLLVLRDATWLDAKVFAFTVLACTLAWTLAAVVHFSRHRRLTVVPGSGPGHADGPAGTPAPGGPGDVRGGAA